MARLSFTVRKTVLGGSGVQQVHPDHLAAGDSDIALRSDDFIYPIQPLGSIGEEDSWLDVLAIDYGVIRLAWSIGIELDVPVSGLTLTELRIVFSDEGTPRAVSDGQTILVLTKDRWAESYDHAISEHAFTQQPWAYYSLFGRFTDGASVWYERLASVSELVPTDQGSHAALYRRIPRHYQMLDEQIAIETDQVDGPLSQFLELFAFEADKHRTLAQQLWRINDPDFTHEQALVALSHQMGLHVDTTDIPAKFLRNILANYGFLRERKGTLIGAMAYLNALTECPISVVRDDIAVNLLSSNVASIETDASGWINLSNASLSRSTVADVGHWASHGSASLRASAVAAGGFSVGTARGTAGIPVTVGSTYTVRADVYASPANLRVRLYLTWFNASGGAISDSVGTYTDVVATTPTGISYAATAPADAAFVSVQVQVETAAIDNAVRVDAVDLNTVGRTTFRDPALPNLQQYTFMIHAQRANLIRTPRFLFGPGTGDLWTAYNATTRAATGLTWDQGSKTLTNTNAAPVPVRVSPAASMRLKPGVPYFGSVQITTSAGTALDATAHAPFMGISSVDPATADPTVPTSFAVEPTIIDPVTREVQAQTYSTTGATVLAWPYFTFTLAAGEAVVLDRWMLQPFNRGPYFDGNHELGGFINDNAGNIAKDYRWTGSAHQSSSIFTEYLSHKRAAVLKSLDFVMPALFVLANDATKHEYRFLFNAMPGDAQYLQEIGTGTVIGRWPPVPSVAEEVPFFGGGLTQIAYRVRVNNGGESTATWRAPLNTAWDQSVDEVFRLRFAIKNDALVSDASDWQLMYSADGGTTWVAVTATSNVVRTAASTFITDGTATLQRISKGPFEPGVVDEVDAYSASTTLSAGEITELEYSLTLRQGDVVNGDAIMLRVQAGNWDALDEYLEIAQLTVVDTDDPALTLLYRSVGSWYDADDTTATDQQVASRIDPSHLAIRGSTTGVDANDVVFLDHTGEHYVWAPADNTNRVTSSMSFDGGDYDLRADLVVDALGTFRRIIDSRVVFEVDTTGNLAGSFERASDSVYVAATSTTAGVTAGTRVQVRVSVVVATATFTFYTRAPGQALSDDTGWVQLGAPVVSASGGGTVTTTAAALNLMSHPTSANSLGGRLYAARRHTGGPVWDFNPERDVDTAANANAGQLSWTSFTGETWTVERSASGTKTAVVTRPTWLIGGSRYLQLPASDLHSFTATTGKYTLILPFRAFGLSTTFGRLFSSESATGQQGLRAYVSSSSVRNVAFGVRGATTEVVSGAGSYVDGQLIVIAVVINDGTFSVWTSTSPNAFVSTKDMTGIGTITAAAPRLGARGDAVSNVFEGEVFAARPMPGVALTPAELTTIANAIIAGAT